MRRSTTLWLLSLVAAASVLPPSASAVELRVTNNCPYTTWLATMPNSDIPDLPDGTVTLNAGERYVYAIPNAGWAGRFWPKVGCDGAGTNCDIGDSSPPCPPTGCLPPADTKVEFNFPPQPPTADSWYDVSLVDGYSIPMNIVPVGSGAEVGACISTTCSMSLDDCPQNEADVGDLRMWNKGKVVGCLAPCKKWNYPPPFGMGQDEQVHPGVMLCCPTPPVSPEECRAGIVVDTQYVNLIHAKCPTAYSYSYDDEAGLHNCPGETSFDVTLCP